MNRPALPLRLEGLETPVPLVDLDRMARNLDRMASYAREHGLDLRPHSKTHKSPRIGAEQVERGAVGLTCATVREVEVMGEVATDILLAYPPVGAAKLRRLMEVDDSVRLTVALDSAEAVDQLATAASEGGGHGGRVVGVLVELDLGMHRVGVRSVSEAITLARHVVTKPSLNYAGIAFYPGHIREHVSKHEEELSSLRNSLGVVLRELRSAGLSPGIVSGGSTPTAWRTHEIEGVTEFRPGTYVYNDRTTVEIGACDWTDCALTVLATVVSTSVPGQAVIDAGSKALGREPLRGSAAQGFGNLLEHPEVTVRAMSEEHGILELGGTQWKPRVGEQVRVVPNHVCIVTHLNDLIFGVRGESVEESWPVSARGRVATGSLSHAH